MLHATIGYILGRRCDHSCPEHQTVCLELELPLGKSSTQHHLMDCTDEPDFLQLHQALQSREQMDILHRCDNFQSDRTCRPFWLVEASSSLRKH